MHTQAFCAPPVLDECNGATDHHRWWRLMPTRGVSALLLMTALVVVLVVFELPLLTGHSHRRRTTVVAAGSVLPDDVGDRRAPSARSSRQRGRRRRRLVGGRLLLSGLRRRRRLHGETRMRRGRADVPPRAVHYRRPARLHITETRQARLRDAQHRHEERRTTEARGRCCESMRAPISSSKTLAFFFSSLGAPRGRVKRSRGHPEDARTTDLKAERFGGSKRASDRVAEVLAEGRPLSRRAQKKRAQK